MRMTIKTKPSNKLCIYCGKEANTSDHIPPKSLFATFEEMRVVPCCKECNNSYSLDEEVFRNWMVNFSYGKSLTADYIFDTKIARSFRYSPILAKRVYEKMYELNLKTPAGILLGKATGVKLDQADWKRIFHILDKIVKGLFYIEFRKVLPKSCTLKHTLINGEDAIKNGLLPVKVFKWATSKHNNVFFYGFSKAPRSSNALFLTEYYGNVDFLTFVVSKDWKKIISSREKEPSHL